MSAVETEAAASRRRRRGKGARSAEARRAEARSAKAAGMRRMRRGATQTTLVSGGGDAADAARSDADDARL
jgi:hypothetical protein